MSRLGDLIKLERTRRGLSAKQVAKKCGVAEKYLLDVEQGTRIIADDQARRILKSMGMQQQTEADFSLDDIAATVDLQSASDEMTRAQATLRKKANKVRPDAEKAASTQEEGVSGSIWLDALANVLKRVPVYNAVMKEVGHRLLPVENGKMFCAETPSCCAMASHVARARARPSAPVPALALPVLITMARMGAPAARCSRHTCTGAAQ